MTGRKRAAGFIPAVARPLRKRTSSRAMSAGSGMVNDSVSPLIGWSSASSAACSACRVAPLGSATGGRKSGWL